MNIYIIFLKEYFLNRYFRRYLKIYFLKIFLDEYFLNGPLKMVLKRCFLKNTFKKLIIYIFI